MKFPEWLKVYGDLDYRNKDCPNEKMEQVSFFNAVRKAYPDTLGVIAYHQRNEAKRSYGQVRMQKAEGLIKGAADIIIPGGPAFVCELKRQDHTLCKWESGQKTYLEQAQNAGAFVCVALGYNAALDALGDWIYKNNITF